MTRLTLGVNPQNAVLVTNLNWQLENALLYYTRWQRRDIPWVRLPDVELHFPFLVRDNEAISRDIVMDAYAARDVVTALRTPVSASAGSDAARRPISSRRSSALCPQARRTCCAC